MPYEDFMAENDAILGEQDDLLEGDAVHGSQEGEGQKQPDYAKTIKQLQEEINSLKADRVRPEPAVSAPPPPPVYEEPEPFSSDDLISDPDAFNKKLNAHLMAKAQPLVNGLLQVQARQAYQDAITKHPHLLDYEKEAAAMLQGANLAQLGSLQTWDVVATMLKEKHFDEIMAKRRSKATPPDTHRSRNGQPPVENSKQLTEAERFTARRLGLTDAQYLAGKERANG